MTLKSEQGDMKLCFSIIPDNGGGLVLLECDFFFLKKKKKVTSSLPQSFIAGINPL